MTEFDALVQAAVLANRRWHQTPGEEFRGSQKLFLRMLKEARQMELLVRYPKRSSLVLDDAEGLLAVRLSPPALIREWDGEMRWASWAGHFPQRRVLGWVTQESLERLLRGGRGEPL